MPGHQFMPTSCHRGRTPPALGACVRHAIGEFAGQRNTSVMPRPHPFDHDHEQHPLSATSPAGVAGAEPDGVNMDRLLTADELAQRLGMKDRVGLGSSPRRPDPARPPWPIPTLPRVSRRGLAARARDRRIGTSREHAIPTDPAAPTRVAELPPLSPSAPVITRRGFVTGAFATPLSSR